MSDPISAELSRLHSLTYMNQYTLITIVVAFVITIIVALLIAFTWGLSALIGLFFLVLAGITLMFKRGNYLDHTVVLFAILAVFFFILQATGYSITIVDFSSNETLMQLYYITH